MTGRFLAWLRKEGFEVEQDDAGIVAVRHSDRTVLGFQSSDEEQPELLVWCLLELERRGFHPSLTNVLCGDEEQNEWQEWTVFCNTTCTPGGDRSWDGSGPTMTAAVLEALMEGA